MSNHALVVFSSIVLLGTVATMPSSERVVASVNDGSEQLFQERVSEYTRLRQQIVGHLLKTGSDVDGGAETGFRRMLATAIQEARHDAQPGDILVPEIADRTLQIVRTNISKRGRPDRQAILSEVPFVTHLRVNDVYPDGEPLATIPPLLLIQLVPLPPELQYRFLADAVILLDVDTNLIIDFIPNALGRRS